MNGYVCFYKDHRFEVRASDAANAQTAAYNLMRDKFPRRKIKAWEIAVMLAEKDGQPVTHSTASL